MKHLLNTVDVVGIFEAGMMKRNKPYDFLLHPSSHLDEPIRHTQLYYADVNSTINIIPTLPSNRRVLMTGTLWHEFFQREIENSGVAALTEVDLTGGLPVGWTGMADLFVWDTSEKAFILWDYKTIKAEGLRYVKNGAKESHIEQVQAYWAAAKALGIPLLEEAYVMYWPIGDGDAPVVADIPVNQTAINAIIDKMEDIYERCEAYKAEVSTTGTWDNKELLPEILRGQSLRKAGEKYELVLSPYWKTRYCPFPEPYCSCSKQSTTKIGTYVLDAQAYVYTPRTGYENILPEITP